MADPTFQLVQLFGTNNLLTIVGIKSIETYQNNLDDILFLRQVYLRKVIRCHPFSSGVDLDTPEGIKEAVTRGKRLFVMEDIFKFLTDNSNYELKSRRKDYIAKGCSVCIAYFVREIMASEEIKENAKIAGTIPDLPSLQYLRDNPFKGDERDYVVPEFESVAAELKSLYQQQIMKIKEMQTASYMETDESNSDQHEN